MVSSSSSLFFIATYYSVIVAWSISYMGFSVKQTWGSDTGEFFINKYLGGLLQDLCKLVE